ncbi:DUF58 domain-containing protein [Paenibacillus aquistagni]|uniref:DUF58 domain-containing protein n=1 Tax=Paenibacillus aquistagni TaxID=1852522 RepID=UPI00145AF2CF|nr:DUF58 domain-containing protein [Paenibacillus aquistagni]NMM51567.1 DUF58 domain-containing protein [Paenibacillus aquistagni]
MTGRSQNSHIRKYLVVYVSLLIYVSLVFYFLFQGGKTSFMVLAMATVLGAYWIAGLFGGIRKAEGTHQFGGERVAPIQAGSHIPVTLQLHMPGWMPIPYIEVRDELYRFDSLIHVQETIVFLDQKRTATLKYHTPILERGCYQFVRTTCTTRDLFGLFRYRGHFKNGQMLYVLPQMIPIQNWKHVSKYKGSLDPEAFFTKHRRESTVVDGIRDYVHGDRLSRIHWNATARSGSLKSKQFEPEGAPMLAIVLDLSQGSYPTAASFELAVSIAASLMRYARRMKRRVVIAGVGDELKLWSAEAVRHETTGLREWLSSVQPAALPASGEDHEAAWLRAWQKHPELRRGGTIAWISGSLTVEQEQRLSHLSKLNWNGSFIAASQYASQDARRLSSKLSRYDYCYIPIERLDQLPERLEGNTA